MDQKFLSQSTYRAGSLQSKSNRALTSFMNRQLSVFNISLPEWSLLGQLILSKKPLKLTDIATEHAIKQPVATRLITKAEAGGLVIRRASKDDNRVVHIYLTKKGRLLANEIEPQLRANMRQFLSDVDRIELVAYLKVMEQIARKA